MLRTSITTGNMAAIQRPTVTDTSVSSAFARPNRSLSSGSRTKARSTLMPVICSRRTRFTMSIRACITR